MSRASLEALTRALREDHQGDDDVGGAETIDRVVADLKRKKVTFLSMRRVPILLIAAAFVSATALAGAKGRLGPMLAAFERLIAGDNQGTAQQAPRETVSAPLPEAVPTPIAEETSAMPSPSTFASSAMRPIVPLPENKGAAPVASVVVAAPSASVSGAPTMDPVSFDESLYREAHRLHFVDRNWSGALTAWDAYLAKVHGGKFALEARYNRALCLVRLGRGSEASRALEPFARGEYGAYRQSEAQALLERLGQAPKAGAAP